MKPIITKRDTLGLIKSIAKLDPTYTVFYQKKCTINSSFFCGAQGEMGPKVDLVDYVYPNYL